MAKTSNMTIANVSQPTAGKVPFTEALVGYAGLIPFVGGALGVLFLEENEARIAQKWQV